MERDYEEDEADGGDGDDDGDDVENGERTYQEVMTPFVGSVKQIGQAHISTSPLNRLETHYTLLISYPPPLPPLDHFQSHESSSSPRSLGYYLPLHHPL